MGLSAEEKAQLDALTAKANQPDDEPDFEMEIYDGAKGARVPYSKGRSWLQTNFGIDLDPDPAKETGETNGEGTAAQGENNKGQGKARRQPEPDAGGQRTGHWSSRIDRGNTA
jgi:hypothetical protein